MKWFEVVLQYGGEENLQILAEDQNEAQLLALQQLNNSLPGNIIDVDVVDIWYRGEE